MMESKALNSIMRTTEVTRNPVDEMSTEQSKKMTEERYENKEVELKRNYDTISKNGDTLELSEEGKNMGEHPDKNKKIISDSGKTLSDSVLTSYSEAKLKQLYADKEITKQQYDRIIKKKKVR